MSRDPKWIRMDKGKVRDVVRKRAELLPKDLSPACCAQGRAVCSRRHQLSLLLDKETILQLNKGTPLTLTLLGYFDRFTNAAAAFGVTSPAGTPGPLYQLPPNQGAFRGSPDVGAAVPALLGAGLLAWHQPQRVPAVSTGLCRSSLNCLEGFWLL